TGWYQENGKWYYLEADGNLAKNKWIGDYYLGANGAMLTSSWTPDGYYVDYSGKWLANKTKQTGWHQENGKWYYLEADGSLAKSKWIGDYYLGVNGAMLTSSWTPDGYYVDENGKWMPNQTKNNKVAKSGVEVFQYKNLKTKTNYSAEDLNRMIAIMGGSSSKLLNKGATFKAAEERYGVNALYLLSHAALESAWGKSRIAVDKNNFFGIKAYDTNPYQSATTFDNVDAGILGAAKWINNRYLINTGFPARGAFLGDKKSGMNVYYATDPLWGYKIAKIMYNLDKKMGMKDS
ncbi:N-acetylglucosaminidase, partial [Gemella sp. zg-1178]|uniref:N-acetylglucosaminidase n=1 Tax=Gemella sp. zg-1178 TaxID=2840372 RepID=UPI001C04093B